MYLLSVLEDPVLSAELLVDVVEGSRGGAGGGFSWGVADELLLIEHGALTAHKAVLLVGDGALRSDGGVAHVEDPAAVLGVGVVAIRLVEAREGGLDGSQQGGGAGGKVQGLEDSKGLTANGDEGTRARGESRGTGDGDGAGGKGGGTSGDDGRS